MQRDFLLRGRRWGDGGAIEAAGIDVYVPIPNQGCFIHVYEVNYPSSHPAGDAVFPKAAAHRHIPERAVPILGG